MSHQETKLQARETVSGERKVPAVVLSRVPGFR